MESLSLSFSVEGQFLTRLSRDFVSEGNWEKGLKLLKDSLIGMTYDQAIMILEGKAELLGSSNDEEGIEYKEVEQKTDSALALDEQLKFLYIGVFKYKNFYWKPYAQVVSWGGEDLVDVDVGNNSFTDERLDKDFGFRSLHYANNKVQDMVCNIANHSADFPYCFLCEKTATPPIWLNITESPVIALNQFIDSGRRIEQRGFIEYYCPTPAADSEEEKEQKPKFNFPTRQEIEKEKAKFKIKMLVEDAAETVTKAKTIHEIRAASFELENQIKRIKEEYSIEFSDDEDGLYDKISKKQEEIYREEITKQANENGGWIELELFNEDDSPYEEKRFVAVPKKPFMMWAIHNWEYNKTQNWKQICPSGLKMVNDDPFHTEWMLAAGCSVDECYQSHDPDCYAEVLMRAAYKKKMAIEYDLNKSDFVILAKAKDAKFLDKYYGPVILGEKNQAYPAGSIVAVPSAGPEYQLAMTSACERYGATVGLLICDTGGKLAHLATVGREMGCTVIMYPEGTKTLVGKTIKLDMENKKLSVVDIN